MTRRHFAALMFALLASSAATAQEETRSEMTIRLAPPNSRSAWRVAKVAPTGEMTLKFEGSGEVRSSVIEGDAFLIPQGAAKALARVLVTGVEVKSISIKTSGEAAKLFAEGDVVLLLRPVGDVPRIKAIPERISLSETKGEGRDTLEELRDAASLATASYHLRTIALGLYEYGTAADRLPPAVVWGPDFKPWHSWRVLILPYLGEADLYAEYDLSQPWDSEKNLKILDKMPAIYRDPIHADSTGHFTNFAALVGEETAFPARGYKMKNAKDDLSSRKLKGTIKFESITDGLDKTLAIVPVSPSRKIPWTKPEDIEFNDRFPRVGDAKGIAAPYKIDGAAVAPVLMMDGSWKILSSKADPAAVFSLATRAGGEEIADDVLMAPKPRSAASTLTIVIEGGKATATIR